MFSSDEGGRERPAYSGYTPTLDFGMVSGGGRFDLPAGAESLKPGDSVTVTVSLNAPASIRNGMRFVIREGVVERGRGVIARIER